MRKQRTDRFSTESEFRAAFGRKVVVNSGTGCHEWQGAKTGPGYGCFRYHGRLSPAHRVAYEWRYGGVLPEMVIHHKCGNKLCVNPDHLQASTQSENVKSAWAASGEKRSLKGKMASAEENGNAVIGLIQALLIRRRRREGDTFQGLADMFGVTDGAIRKAIDGRTWSHLPGALSPEEVKATRRYATGDRNSLSKSRREQRKSL